MNEQLRGLLRSPGAGSPLLSLDDPPRLRSEATGEEFPIRDGIPRFVREEYLQSFGRQWNRYEVARPEEDDRVFRVKAGIDPSSLAGKLVLDAGCGGGRYLRLLAGHGATVLGVDKSVAVEAAAKLCAEFPNAAVVQADLFDLPIADACFDVVFSIGVLHHSPDPRRAFAQIARKVKPGGRLAVWLYRRNTMPQEWINSGLRAVTTRLPGRILEPACAVLGGLGSVPVLNRTLNKVFNFSNHPDWTLRVCDNFDWYAPRYQSHHTVGELKGWFREEGFGDLAELAPEKTGRIYGWAYRNNLIPGSGVNVAGTRLG